MSEITIFELSVECHICGTLANSQQWAQPVIKNLNGLLP